ncbi:hypothetical protein [Haloarchaeobius iranensis]|uniref:Uncharacterized protein n=1 Tax=Haloarchaeobius iranensis TaxID=996166 RepID=A0A1G9UCZ7_9EURY|nr:hypothetical protein [Haloarchaeobius iranensis]SDM57435.1 hypothetical protein SAMN05192554_10448 [Haloarchaeobius iranensis]
MRRRALLSTAGATLAGLAGCLSGSTGDDPADETDTTNGTVTPTDQPTTTQPAESPVDVSLATYQPAIVELATDSIHVIDDAGGYLFLSVDATAADAPPGRGEFTFVHGDEAYSPVDPVERQLWRQYHEDDSYGDGNESGWLLFELPEVVAAEHARVGWPGGEWRPGESLRTRLAAEYPALSMSFSVPETVPKGEHPTVTLTVRNEGDVDARFVAGLNRVGPRIAYTPVTAPSFIVPAGGSETWEYTGDFDTTPLGDGELGDGQHDMTYHLNSVLGRQSRQVRYVASDG